jgi:hypothetical protein
MRESVLRRKLTGKGASECSGCGPEFTSRTPSGWPGLGASCRLDESASAAGGGRRRRPQVSSDRVTPKPSRPGTTADTGPGCPPRLLDARPGQTHPIRRGAPLCHLARRPTRPGNELTLRVPDVRAPRRARSRVTRLCPLRGIGSGIPPPAPRATRVMRTSWRRSSGWIVIEALLHLAVQPNMFVPHPCRREKTARGGSGCE